MDSKSFVGSPVLSIFESEDKYLKQLDLEIKKIEDEREERL